MSVEELVVWSHPLPRGEARDRWIACVLGMVESEARDGGSHIASHWIFAKKVLRETKRDCMEIAAWFQCTPLTLQSCHRIADDWWEPANEAETRDER